MQIHGKLSYKGILSFMLYNKQTRYYREIKTYLRVARIDHWFKNIFLLAGSLMALLCPPNGLPSLRTFFVRTSLAFFLACLASSANYIINEILDAPYDKHHPTKRFRPIPAGIIKSGRLWGVAALFCVSSLGIAYIAMPIQFFLSILFLLIMGIIYNVPPVRTKEVAYLDIVTESINNPIRLFMGWYAVTTAYPPPLTLVLSYWAFGAFLMTAKRYAEYRFIKKPDIAAAYRLSFRKYNEENLLIMMICYIALTM